MRIGFELKAAIHNHFFAHIACGELAFNQQSGTFIHACKIEVLGCCRLSTRLYGDLFLLRCTFVLYAFIRSYTNISQSRSCSPTECFRPVMVVLLKCSACPLVCGWYDVVVVFNCLLAD